MRKTLVPTRRNPICAGDDQDCPEFELHHRKFKETLDRERRSFLKSSFGNGRDDDGFGFFFQRNPRPQMRRDGGGGFFPPMQRGWW